MGVWSPTDVKIFGGGLCRRCVKLSRGLSFDGAWEAATETSSDPHGARIIPSIRIADHVGR